MTSYLTETLIAEIDSIEALMDVTIGDPTKTYESEYYIAESAGRVFVVVGRPATTETLVDGVVTEVRTGRTQDVPIGELVKWQKVFGIDYVVPMSNIPEPVEEL